MTCLVYFERIRYFTSPETHGQSRISLLTVGQLIERFMFSWIIHDLVWLASSYFLRENLTEFCFGLRKHLSTTACFHQTSIIKIQQSSFSHPQKLETRFFMYEFVIINFHSVNPRTLMYPNTFFRYCVTSWRFKCFKLSCSRSYRLIGLNTIGLVTCRSRVRTFLGFLFIFTEINF